MPLRAGFSDRRPECGNGANASRILEVQYHEVMWARSSSEARSILPVLSAVVRITL